MMTISKWRIWAFLLLLSLTAVDRALAVDHNAGDVVLEPTSLTTPETGEVKFELGTFYVPENRNDPKSRVIGVGFARFKALTPSKVPPQFHLPGGPGNSMLTRLKPDAQGLAATLKSYNQ